MSTGRRGLLGRVAAWVACTAMLLSPARAQDRRAAYERARSEGLRLLNAGRYDEALSAYGGWGPEMGRALLQQIEDAKRAARREQALALYGAYFHYYPFGYLYWHQDARSWSAAALDYLALRRAAPSGEPDPELSEEIAAAGPYRKLAEAHERYDWAACVRLADEIVAGYPRTLFAAAAALSVAHLREQGAGRSNQEATEIYEAYLARLRAAGAPERGQILLLLAYAERCMISPERKPVLRKALAAYQEIGRRTDISYEKRYALLRGATAALWIAERDSLEQSRALFREFLRRYPEVPEAAEARLGIVRTYLQAERREEALAALRDLERATPAGAGLADALFAISQARFQATDYTGALALLQEVIERYPDTPTASLARLGIAETYAKVGDEEQMAAAYEKAARAVPIQTQTNLMDASDTRNRAVVALATYLEKKGKWTEALRWWEEWRPSSWCGNAIDAMSQERAYHIALCLSKLGRVEEALKTLEAAILAPSLGGGRNAAVLYVDLQRERGRLDAVEQKLRPAVGTPPSSPGAALALQYLGILRMAEREEAAGLWKLLDRWPQYSGGEWPCELAAQLLVAMPDVTIPYAAEKARGENLDHAWGVELVGRMDPARVLPILKAQAEANRNTPLETDYLRAIARLGTEEAEALLRQYAAESQAARDTLMMNVEGPLEFEFVRGVRWSAERKGYDPALPGYHLEGGIAVLGTRWRWRGVPGRLVLAIRTSPGMRPNLEGFTLVAGDREITSALLGGGTEEIRTRAGDGPGATESSAPKGTYFRMEVIGDEVRVSFTPKAIELLRQPCTLRWVDWYRG